MEKSKSFEDLEMWKKAHEFVLSVYLNTECFPKHELFGLTSQFRRSAVSIAANIAEGYKKKGKADKLRFYNIAQGSLEESRYYIILSKDLKYLDTNNYSKLNELLKHTSYLLNTYMKNINLNEMNIKNTNQKLLNTIS